jgi:methylmalonyl-CoA carboxyltransferase large subunit
MTDTQPDPAAAEVKPGADQDTLTLLMQMREEIGALRQRVSQLEHSAAQAAAKPAAPTEEEMVALSAAVAAFLGVRARIRQVRLVQSSAWAQVGRMGTHASHHTH